MRDSRQPQSEEPQHKDVAAFCFVRSGFDLRRGGFERASRARTAGTPKRRRRLLVFFTPRRSALRHRRSRITRCYAILKARISDRMAMFCSANMRSRRPRAFVRLRESRRLMRGAVMFSRDGQRVLIRDARVWSGERPNLTGLQSEHLISPDIRRLPPDLYTALPRAMQPLSRTAHRADRSQRARRLSRSDASPFDKHAMRN